MSSSTDKEVIVTLSQTGPKSVDMTFIDRRLTLSAEDGRVAIGRTSKSISKGRVATDVNGLYDCAVMSRNHAVIYTRLGDVFIEDTTSMHGTFVNGTDIRGRSPHQLRTGDGLRFGIPINRGEDSFSPVLVTVGIDKQERQLPLIFGVPDASESELEASDGEDNYHDDDFTQRPATSPQVVDLTSPVSSPPLHSSPNPLPVSDLDSFTVKQVVNVEDVITASSLLGGSAMSSDGDLKDALFDSSNNDAGDFDEDSTDNVDSEIYSEEVDPSIYDKVDSDCGSDFEDPQDAKNPENTDGAEDIENVENAEPDVFGWPKSPEPTATIEISTITGPAHLLPPTTNEPVFTVYAGDGTDRQETSRKRKAADLSEITKEELTWGVLCEAVAEERPAQDQETVSVAAPATPICFVDNPRPSKRLRRFAASLGYAALGGITAAAVTFGSLAYTAPSF
ncbi:hypothetical protein PpBr36_01661 [Pyricularia pennisetigena]|uniref:hypothetical protein n=1 Tax=Pyricularia pennisetigena TaxID=1578925 RepID=UPI00114FDDE4|nr:hypothetical protein PpBr36_01661 [Pyricularia pennisetigena]TLS28111.1 hypothetical protein PpBr36_01661 [Pyricularia pennisetigena]